MRIDNGATNPPTNPSTDATNPPPFPSDATLIEWDYDRCHDIIDDLKYEATENRETMCLSDRLIMLTTQPTRSAKPSSQLVNEHNQPADEWLIELCDDYLSQLHAGSWGRTFYITNDDGRRAAAEFLATTIEGVNNARQQRSTRR